MEKTNLYWDISGWSIFDQMDRYAHKYAISKIWDCTTATASINFISPVRSIYKTTIHRTIQFIELNKIGITTTINVGNTVLATASFLFIAKKNPQ